MAMSCTSMMSVLKDYVTLNDLVTQDRFPLLPGQC